MRAPHRRILFVLLPLSLTLAASFPWIPGRGDGGENGSAAPALPVLTQTASAETGYVLRRVLSGRVLPARRSILGFEQAGRLVEIHVRAGATVGAGETLAELDRERLQVRRAEATAALAEARAGFAIAEATLARMEGVVGAGGVSRQGLDEARERRQGALAAVELARRRIESLDLELDRTRLKAPFDGVVAARMVDEGTVLAAGVPVLELQERGRSQIRLAVGGPLADELSIGRIYDFDWQGRRVPARLRAILPLRAASTRTVDALFDALAEPPALRAGDLVRLHLCQTVSEPGHWVPLSALTEAERGLWGVYVAVPDTRAPAGLAATHRLERRSVHLLHPELERAYVRGTLLPGDRMVVDGVHRLVPGQWVRALQDPGTGSAGPAPATGTGESGGERASAAPGTLGCGESAPPSSPGPATEAGPGDPVREPSGRLPGATKAGISAGTAGEKRHG